MFQQQSNKKYYKFFTLHTFLQKNENLTLSMNFVVLYRMFPITFYTYNHLLMALM